MTVPSMTPAEARQLAAIEKWEADVESFDDVGRGPTGPTGVTGSTGPPQGARFNRWWLVLWLLNVLVLAGLLAAGISTVGWFTAFLGLFMAPELVGLRVRGDTLPPLTYAVRRYAPRWLPDAATWVVAAWMTGSWVLSGRAAHPTLVLVMIFGTAGWLTNHWDVTYDGPGE